MTSPQALSLNEDVLRSLQKPRDLDGISGIRGQEVDGEDVVGVWHRWVKNTDEKENPLQTEVCG